MDNWLFNKLEYNEWIIFTMTEDCKIELCFECEFASQCIEFSEIRDIE